MTIRPAPARAHLAIALSIVTTLSWGCTLRTARAGPSDPTNRAGRAAEALQRDAFAAARYELYWLATRCEAGAEGRRALLLLAAVELDPQNPYGSPDAAARAAARYLLLPDAELDQVPLARSLYRIAVDLGGAPGTPDDVPSDDAFLAARYDTCMPEAVVTETKTLPSVPEVTTAHHTRVLEATLVTRADSLEAMQRRVGSWRARIAELEAEIERITALLREGTPGRSDRGRR